MSDTSAIGPERCRLEFSLNKFIRCRLKSEVSQFDIAELKYILDVPFRTIASKVKQSSKSVCFISENRFQ